jgi:lipopolysaccharide/colanic/teichoic acid biosynthesis glycosyltransferase
MSAIHQGERTVLPPALSVVSTLMPAWPERRPSRVRPGITGVAQVRGGYAENYHETREKHTYELYYIKYFGPALDRRVAALTSMVVAGRQVPFYNVH